jgi:hypothetical protein
MDAVTKSPFPFAFMDLFLHVSFPKEKCCTATSGRVPNARYRLIAFVHDHLYSLDRTRSEPAFRKTIPGQNQLALREATKNGQ